MNKQSKKPIQTRKNMPEIDFRIWFKNEYGMDYLEALHNLDEQKEESNRKWNQILVKYNLV